MGGALCAKSGIDWGGGLGIEVGGREVWAFRRVGSRSLQLAGITNPDRWENGRLWSFRIANPVAGGMGVRKYGG